MGLIAAPSGLAVASATSGGTLTAGTYYYVVTALSGGNQAVISPKGETTASGEANGTTSGGNLTLPVTWNAVAGASAYNVYRGTVSGSETYLTTVTTNSYTDAGGVTQTSSVYPPTVNTTDNGGRIVPQLYQNPSTASIPAPFLVDLSDGTSRRDLAHHIAIGDVITAAPLRLSNSLSATPALIGTTATTVNSLAIPTNALNVGSDIRVTIRGNVATANAFTTALYFGPTGTTSDTLLVSLASGTPTANTGFAYEAMVTCQSVGATGTVWPEAQVTVSGAAPTLSHVTAAVTVDTVEANVVTVVITGGAASSVQVTNSVIEFLDAAF